MREEGSHSLTGSFGEWLRNRVRARCGCVRQATGVDIVDPGLNGLMGGRGFVSDPRNSR